MHHKQFVDTDDISARRVTRPSADLDVRGWVFR